MHPVRMSAFLLQFLVALGAANGQLLPSVERYQLDRDWNYTSSVSVATSWLEVRCSYT